ncbi:o-succinylbenzoate synthase [Curtobacterium flaccumfaciens]|uniref:o-succinylbenzoate synthase n=1 Tax=Curtobacterium flaccumfaciens TaxID=2035 RepID=UPI001BDE62D6|nr:o-succinylbenzoate synthase [Curtobacterium flaccumfaciens]MBT1605393.1 o-succinylbenzoate synthase [Curtobacterium flaccumfaciens pv. betae]MBT1655498.1 o-succinylbenzoate synthase [Curtobacterium flaccumfaciens pv. betae]MCS0470384.1 o-succinylbenzoate synthase [Curtobacterium flaccumfaciens pv. betae]MCS0473748.1 o-succinylbenzoate synthase [Curtobacterium flaccumfaciens pv. betae]MCS0478747.1 o-succinylbenzoate synthase [Curtobacterium flaccumfaciens pv. betae]
MADVLPDLAELLADAHVVALPMRVRFRGITTREAVVLRGPAGWTEFSPFVEYDDAEAAAWLRATVDFGWTDHEPAADSVPVNATVPAIAADAVADLLARYPGCTTAKVKVAEPGTTVDDDVARVAAVRRVMGPEAAVRVDANGLWSVEQASAALERLAPFDLQYAEQPCATVPELAELRSRVAGLGVRVAADESVRKASDPLAVARAGAADVLVVKAQPLGGISAARAVIADAGLPCVVSSALDTSVGLGMGAFLAAAAMTPGYAAGLGTAVMFAGDVTADPLLPDGGRVPVRRVDVAPELVERSAASPERTAWWRARVARVHALLAAG